MGFKYAQRRPRSQPPQHSTASAPGAPTPSAANPAAAVESPAEGAANGQESATSATGRTEPLGRAIAGTLLFPIGGVVLAAILFAGIRIHDGSATKLAAATPASARSIVEGAIKTDLTAERLKDAFGITAAVPAVCTTEPLAPLPPAPTAPTQAPGASPPKTAAEIEAIKKQEAAARRARRATERIAAAKALRERRDACRALLATRLSSEPSTQLLVQILVDAVVERALSRSAENEPPSQQGSAPATSGVVSDFDEAMAGAITTWLNELKSDAFTGAVIASANMPVAAASRTTDKDKPRPSAADPVEQGLARVLSAARLDAALKRGFTADFRPTFMGNGVAGWSKDVVARLAWATMAFVFCAAFAFVLIAAFGQLRNAEKAAAWRWTAIGSAIAFLLVVLVLFAPRLFAADGVTIDPLQETLAFAAMRYGLSVHLAMTVLDSIAVVGAVFLIVGSVATFLVEVHTAEDVKVQLSGLRTLFNSGAIFLLAGTLQLNALIRWPAMFYPDAIGQSLIATANWVATAVGAVSTIVLLAVYLPSVTVLHEQIRWLKPEERPAAESAFTALGFGDAGIQQIARTLQALAPVLTGLTLTVASTL